MSLSPDPKSWVDTIESSGAECLNSPVSAKNVRTVLSRAVIRGPQKNLCHSILPFVAEMMKNRHALSIIVSLVLYGTPATVEKIAAEVLKTNLEHWKFSNHDATITCAEEQSDLLDAFVYREDSSGEKTSEIRNSLRNSKSLSLRSEFTLPAAGRLLATNCEYRTLILADKASYLMVGNAAITRRTKLAVEKFFNNAMMNDTESEDNGQISQFLLQSVQKYLQQDSAEKLHDNLLLCLAKKGHSSIIDKLGSTICGWSNAYELGKQETFSKIFSEILERGSETTGIKVIKKIFSTTADIDERIASRKLFSLRLLSAVSAKEKYTKALNEKVGEDQHLKLRGAKVQYLKASAGGSCATRSAIQEKLKLLSLTAGAKRSRE